MSVDRLAQRIDAASARLLDLRGRLRQLDLVDRDGFAGDVARLHVLLDGLQASESDARALETALREEQATREIERRRYRDLLDLVPVAALLTTTTGLIQLANRAAADLLGVPAHWLIGKSLGAFIAERPAAFFTRLSQLQDADAGPVAYEDHLRLLRGGPLAARVTVSAVHNPVGEVTGLQWIVQERNDATSPPGSSVNGSRPALAGAPKGVPVSSAAARQRLLVGPRGAEAYYRSLFDSAPDAIIIFNLDRHFFDANRAAHDLLGYADAEIEGLRLDDLAIYDAERLDAIIVSLRRDGSWRGDLELRRNGGGIVTVEAAISTIASPVGIICRAALREIPDRRREQEEHAREQRDLVAMIGHELMNPLNGILLHAELLKMLGTYREGSVDAILTSVRHEQRLIDDLMDLARTDAMRLRLQPAYVDLLPILRTCIVASRTGTNRPVLRLDAPNELPFGYWDQGRLQEVFHNLVGNAIKYSPGDSEIRLIVEDLPDRVRVSVVDQGAGIDAAALPNVFDRFFRADSTKGGIRGLGLGLHITKTLVEAHGGTISVESEVGTGSIFRVTLPYEPGGARHRRVISAGEP